MTVTAVQQSSSPLDDSNTLPNPSHVLPQSRRTGEILSSHHNRHGNTVTPDKAAVKPWAHLVGGAIGGMTAATLTSPLDVLKTRLQSDFYQAQLRALHAAHPPRPVPAIIAIPRASWYHFAETFQILASIQSNEGVRGLFRGLGANLVGVLPARSINFFCYGNGKRILNDRFNPEGRENVWQINLVAAALAGAATGTATNPIWLVKTRLQLDKSNASNDPLRGRQYRNSWDCIKQTVRGEGVRALWKGLSASYLGVTESTIQWVLYEQMKLVLARREARHLADKTYKPSAVDRFEEWGGKFTAASGAKFFAAAITYPHEVVRTRLRQAPTVVNGAGKPRMKYTSLVQCFRLIWREEGMAGLYGGMTPHLLRVVPSAGIMFITYEGVLSLAGTKL